MPFTLEKDGAVARLILDRPNRRNAMDRRFFAELRSHFERFDRDDAVRVVVITAAGSSFCAGTDLAEAAAIAAVDSDERLRAIIVEMQRAVDAVEACRKPVLAAVHGHCLGGGLDLVCACDVRLAERSAVFSLREVRVGIVADLGVLQRLPPIVGEGRTRELALTGRDFSAAEAQQMGLVSRVCDGREQLQRDTETLAAVVAANPPLAVQAAKQALNYSRDHTTGEGLSHAVRRNLSLLRSGDFREALAAFREKRKPDFRGR